MTQDMEEKISAFLDGAMSDEEADAFATAMEADPALAAAVERWQANDALLQSAYAAPMTGPVPDALLARLGLDQPRPQPVETAAGDNVVNFADARNTRAAQQQAQATNDNLPARWRWPALGAIAASLLVALVAIPQWQAGQGKSLDGNPAFQVAMQTARSAQTVAMDGAGQLTPVLTFQAADGRFCREFAVNADKNSQSGIACRDDNAWKIEKLINSGGAPTSGADYQAAAGNDGAGLEGDYRTLGASDPISAEQETALIAKGWRR